MKERVVSFHLPLDLFQFRPQRQIPGLSFAADADVEQVLRSVARVVLARTGAIALAALAVVHGNGAAAEIAEILNLTEQVLAT